MTKNKLIIILGQTATGKSDFAVEVAKLNKGEIISADSRQVYKGMDLGSGKITKKEMLGVPHYLLDIVSPSKIFSVSDFQKLALREIEKIIKKPAHPHSRSEAGGNKIPIICGGTGFYIDSIVNGTIFPEVPPNKKLREKLYSKSAIALFEYLKKLDPKRAESIDRNNKVRLVRAIEIAKALGRVPPTPGVGETKFDILKIGLKVPDEILKERIKLRLLSRIKKGMIKEIKDLHEKKNVSWKRLESFGLEYRYVALYLQGKLSKEEMINKLNTEIWHFAKRQNTWFKRDKEIIWINPLKKSEKLKALKDVKKFLK